MHSRPPLTSLPLKAPNFLVPLVQACLRTRVPIILELFSPLTTLTLALILSLCTQLPPQYVFCHFSAGHLCGFKAVYAI